MPRAFRSSVRLLAPALLAGASAAQEIVHFAFDATDADRVVNYARGPLAAPPLADLSWPASYSYTDGRFGGALEASPFGGASGHFARTGWAQGHTGALTIAFFLRNRMANSISEYSPVAGQPSWSIATGGSAGAGLQLRGWGGPDLNGDFGTALCSLPGWNHFAIVVDPQAGNATWYFNGQQRSQTPIAVPVVIPANQHQLYVGTDYVTWCGSLYDVDEFRMVAAATTNTEIMNWAQSPSAAVRQFTTATLPAHAVTLDANGTPVLGNASFSLVVRGPATGPFALAAGTSYALHGTLALPLDLSALLPVPAGTSLLVSPAATAVGALASGEGEVRLPVPQAPALAGFELFAQAFALDAGSVLGSNALAIRAGR